MKRDSITWFEIPARDLGRAQAFYEQVLNARLHREEMGGSALAVFPKADDGVSGCLMAGAEVAAPHEQGTLVYLDAGPVLADALARVAPAGGRVTQPRTELPAGMGCYAHIVDTEGNRVGLHAPA